MWLKPLYLLCSRSNGRALANLDSSWKNQMFFSWFFFFWFLCLDWITSSPCRKIWRDFSCSATWLNKGSFGEISCDIRSSHPAVTVVSSCCWMFCYFHWGKGGKGENTAEISHMQHVGVEDTCERVGVSLKNVSKLNEKLPWNTEGICGFKLTTLPPCTYKEISYCCCQALRQNLGRYCVGLLHLWWSSSDTSSCGETDDLT